MNEEISVSFIRKNEKSISYKIKYSNHEINLPHGHESDLYENKSAFVFKRGHQKNFFNFKFIEVNLKMTVK